MTIKGTIKRIGETESFGSSNFKKRELVITTEEQYPQHISVEFVQDKCGLLDTFLQGESVTVSINLRGREWTSPQGEVKYFNTIQGWRIEGADEGPSQPNAQPAAYNPDDLDDELGF